MRPSSERFLRLTLTTALVLWGAGCYPSWLCSGIRHLPLHASTTVLGPGEFQDIVLAFEERVFDAPFDSIQTREKLNVTIWGSDARNPTSLKAIPWRHGRGEDYDDVTILDNERVRVRLTIPETEDPGSFTIQVMYGYHEEVCTRVEGKVTLTRAEGRVNE